MELTQSLPQKLPPSTLLSLPMPMELLYQLTQITWLPPLLTLLKKLTESDSLVNFSDLKRGEESKLLRVINISWRVNLFFVGQKLREKYLKSNNDFSYTLNCFNEL